MYQLTVFGHYHPRHQVQCLLAHHSSPSWWKPVEYQYLHYNKLTTIEEV